MRVAHGILYSSLRPHSGAANGAAQRLRRYCLEMATVSEHLPFSWGSPHQGPQSYKVPELAINHPCSHRFLNCLRPSCESRQDELQGLMLDSLHGPSAQCT